MSRTLFWYIFKDLLRIFLLASGCLAGIMSFGGLLRPLTEHGLGAGQVARILGYFMPAMQTYSLPVAALFATTMTYGRLSSDNELTACRAAGISALSIAMPAFVLGIVVSLISFAFLYFIVPICTLQVERIIYSNIAQLVANKIEQNHRIELPQGPGKPDLTIFAQQAQVLPPPPQRPHDQVVRLVAPVFIQYEQPESKRDRDRALPPQDFYMARSATAFISQDQVSGETYLHAVLEGGMKFPRNPRAGNQNALQVSVEKTGFFADPMESLVRENTKFMALGRLQELYREPEKSRRLTRVLRDFILDDQRKAFLTDVAARLNSPQGIATFDSGAGESYVLERGGAASAEVRGDKLVVGSPDGPAPEPPPRLRQTSGGGVGGLEVTARLVEMRVTPTIVTGTRRADPPQRLLNVDIEMADAQVKAGETVTARTRWPRNFSVPMPAELQEMEKRRVDDYRTGNLPADRKMGLERAWYRLSNSIISELYARASFSVSCLILVLVGCALGMMFKSGNFLSAFALSVVPAMICILLIVTGQHTCENVPWDLSQFNNAAVLNFGLSMIWAGNALIAVLAVVLLGRLQRQ